MYGMLLLMMMVMLPLSLPLLLPQPHNPNPRTTQCGGFLGIWHPGWGSSKSLKSCLHVFLTALRSVRCGGRAPRFFNDFDASHALFLGALLNICNALPVACSASFIFMWSRSVCQTRLGGFCLPPLLVRVSLGYLLSAML